MAYLNVGVSPHTLKDAWMQPLFTMFVTRLALEDCSLQPYSGLLGIGTNRKGEYGLPTQVNDLALDKVPTPKDAGILGSRHPIERQNIYLCRQAVLRSEEDTSE